MLQRRAKFLEPTEQDGSWLQQQIVFGFFKQ